MMDRTETLFDDDIAQACGGPVHDFGRPAACAAL